VISASEVYAMIDWSSRGRLMAICLYIVAVIVRPLGVALYYSTVVLGHSKYRQEQSTSQSESCLTSTADAAICVQYVGYWAY